MTAKKLGVQRYGFFFLLLLFQACNAHPFLQENEMVSTALPRFRLVPTDTFSFNNFVDCNMAEA